MFHADKLPREHHTLQHPLATIGDLVDAEVCELVSPAGGIQGVVMVKAERLCQGGTQHDNALVSKHALET